MSWHLEQNTPDFVTQDIGEESEQEDRARVATDRATVLLLDFQGRYVDIKAAKNLPSVREMSSLTGLRSRLLAHRVQILLQESSIVKGFLGSFFI